MEAVHIAPIYTKHDQNGKSDQDQVAEGNFFSLGRLILCLIFHNIDRQDAFSFLIFCFYGKNKCIA